MPDLYRLLRVSKHAYVLKESESVCVCVCVRERERESEWEREKGKSFFEKLNILSVISDCRERIYICIYVYVYTYICIYYIVSIIFQLIFTIRFSSLSLLAFPFMVYEACDRWFNTRVDFDEYR